MRNVVAAVATAGAPTGYPVTPGDVLAKLARPGPSCRSMSALIWLFPAREGARVRASSVIHAVISLVKAGLVEVWNVEGQEPSVVLTPLEAERSGLVLDDQGKRWRPSRDKRKYQPKIRGKAMDGLDLDQIADPKSPDPAKLWAWQGDGRPLPTILLGERLIWEGPRWVAKRPCEGCSRQRRGAGRYCLLCDKRKG